MPVVPLLVRAAQKDVRIGDTVVPRGSLMTAHFLAMHTSARYWERPKDFIPVCSLVPWRLPLEEHGFGHQPCIVSPGALGRLQHALQSLSTPSIMAACHSAHARYSLSIKRECVLLTPLQKRARAMYETRSCCAGEVAGSRL